MLFLIDRLPDQRVVQAYNILKIHQYSTCVMQHTQALHSAICSMIDVLTYLVVQTTRPTLRSK